MARSLGVLVTSGLLWLTVGWLLAGCGGGDGSTSAPAAAGTSGGERPVARLYWLTQEGNRTARALYDRVGQFKGFIRYDHPLR